MQPVSESEYCKEIEVVDSPLLMTYSVSEILLLKDKTELEQDELIVRSNSEVSFYNGSVAGLVISILTRTIVSGENVVPWAASSSTRVIPALRPPEFDSLWNDFTHA